MEKMPKVTKIPPRLNPATFAPLESVEKRKVAGYARVSTDSEEQKLPILLKWITIRNSLKNGSIGNLSEFIQTKASVQQTPGTEKDSTE